MVAILQSPHSVIDVVRDFRADKTGASDASSAIQAAIDSLTSPGIIFLPPGTFKTTSALTMKTGVTLQGSGKGVTSIANASAGLDSLSFVYASGPTSLNASVRDLTVTKSGAGTPRAAVNLTRCALVKFENVELLNHVYGDYHYFGEQHNFKNCLIQGNTYGSYFDGGGTASASNFNLYEKCFYNSNGYDTYFASSAHKNTWRETPFYSSTTASVYIPSSATSILESHYERCWWEAVSGLILDLRAGSGFAFDDCTLAQDKDFVTSANFSHTRLRVRDLIDLSGIARSISNADYEVTDRNPVNNVVAQLIGTGYSQSRDSSHSNNLIARGFGGRSFVTPGLSAGAGEKNFVATVDFSSGSWALSGGSQPTGGFADPINGTAAYRLTAGSTVYNTMAGVNGGSALAGATVTFQVWAKSAGGKLQINLSDSAFAGTVTKYVRLLNSEWALCSFTIPLPAVATATGVAVVVGASDQSIDLFWPSLVLGRNVVPRLPVSRDMSGWAGPYETFGPLPNIRVYVSNAAPAAGTWAVGDEAVNYAPAAGGTDRWRCTTGGTPGTWKATAVTA